MKPLTSALFLGLSLGLANLVIAEPYEERSERITTTVYPSGSWLNAGATVVSGRFKAQRDGVASPGRGFSPCAVKASQWDWARVEFPFEPVQ